MSKLILTKKLLYPNKTQCSITILMIFHLLFLFSQMGDEFHLTVKDLVKNLRLAFLKFM